MEVSFECGRSAAGAVGGISVPFDFFLFLCMFLRFGFFCCPPVWLTLLLLLLYVRLFLCFPVSVCLENGCGFVGRFFGWWSLYRTAGSFCTSSR